MGQALKGRQGLRGQAASGASSRDTDVFAWTRQQAALLKSQDFKNIDFLNIAEELLEVGNSEFDKLESNLRIVLLHMLKWDCQPDRRARSCALSIREHRRRVGRVLKKNPGLSSFLGEALEAAYDDARDEAAMETGLPLHRFPEASPYDWHAITEREFQIDPPETP